MIVTIKCPHCGKERLADTRWRKTKFELTCAGCGNKYLLHMWKVVSKSVVFIFR